MRLDDGDACWTSEPNKDESRAVQVQAPYPAAPPPTAPTLPQTTVPAQPPTPPPIAAKTGIDKPNVKKAGTTPIAAPAAEPMTPPPIPPAVPVATAPTAAEAAVTRSFTWFVDDEVDKEADCKEFPLCCGEEEGVSGPTTTSLSSS